MRYLAPQRSAQIFNGLAKWLAFRGVSLLGSRVLAVRGRKSGEVRTTVVNLFTYQGVRYLLAPRGHTQWVRNLRAAGEGELRLGRRVERFTPVEIADPDKPPLIRLYLRKWAWETGAFFDGLKADSPEREVAAAAPRLPGLPHRPGLNPDRGGRRRSARLPERLSRRGRLGRCRPRRVCPAPVQPRRPRRRAGAGERDVAGAVGRR